MGYSTDIKLDLMVTGSNSGTWGTKTNTNLQLIEEALCGYIDQTIAGGAGTTALTIADASSSNGRNMVIKLSGTITGNRIVTVPTTLEKMWIFSNETSGAYTVQLKGASDGGSGYTFSTTNKGKRILYMTGTNLVDAGFSSSALDDVVDDTTPQLGGDLDVNGNDIISASNANIDIIPHGTGNVNLGTDTIQAGSSGENVTLTTSGTGDLTLNTNNGTNSGSISIADGANANITVAANGSGSIILTGTTSGSAIKDQDDMSSDSASHLATQQSIKAYVDTRILTEDTIAELNDTTITSVGDNEVLAYDNSSSK